MKRVGEFQPDGSFYLHVKAVRPTDNRWHRPSPCVPRHQWHPGTGMTRYAWARQETPEHQLSFWEEFRGVWHEAPPKPLDEETRLFMASETVILPSGLGGYSKKVLTRLLEGGYEKHLCSPDGLWRFFLMADQAPGGGITDKILLSHKDYRTLADWELILRARSWAWEDHVESFIWMPGQDTSREGWATRYENGRPNAIQILSFRPETADED